MKKQSSLQICNETIHPGENLSLALPLPQIFSCAPLYMPIRVIHGKYEGPCLLITAAMHGNEVNGTAIIHRLLSTIKPSRLCGTVIAIPVLNVYGLINRTRTMPGGIDLDTCFPGSKTGTHAARLADLFTTEIFSKADFCIDLQTGAMNYSNLPQIYVDFADKEARQLAHVFSAPVISHTTNEKGSLRMLAFKNNKPLLTYEAGEAMRFDEHSIKTGLKGIQNVVRYLKMLTETTQRKSREQKSFFTEKTIWIHAATSGMSYTAHKLGQHVKKGERLCVIRDPFSAVDSLSIHSPEEGIIVAKNNHPLIHEGEALFQLAVFPKMKHAATHLSTWKDDRQLEN